MTVSWCVDIQTCPLGDHRQRFQSQNMSTARRMCVVLFVSRTHDIAHFRCRLSSAVSTPSLLPENIQHSHKCMLPLLAQKYKAFTRASLFFSCTPRPSASSKISLESRHVGSLPFQKIRVWGLHGFCARSKTKRYAPWRMEKRQLSYSCGVPDVQESLQRTRQACCMST